MNSNYPTCPFCNSIWSNHISFGKLNNQTVVLKCENHKPIIKLYKYKETEELVLLELKINNDYYDVFFENNQEIVAYNIYKYDDVISIPFFSPNFNDFNKLINKLKTYITFI